MTKIHQPNNIAALAEANDITSMLVNAASMGLAYAEPIWEYSAQRLEYENEIGP